MIVDSRVLADIRQDWAGVEALKESLIANGFASVTLGGGLGFFPFKLADAAHNVPFLHAYATLHETLKQLRREGRINSRNSNLTPLLEASEGAIQWQDFTLIRTGVDHRNALAHQGKFLNRGECWKYIDGIGRELLAWGVL